MQCQPQISFRNINNTSSLRKEIEEHVERLERFFPRIVGCRVVVAAPHRHHRKGEPYQVRIDVSVPGSEIVVKPKSRIGGNHADVHIALTDTFHTTTRRLQDYARRRRGAVKLHAVATNAQIHGQNPEYFPEDFGV